MQCRRGFTLLELSIVLVVMGLVLSAGSRWLQSYVAAEVQQRNAALLEQAKTALLGYVRSTKRLPESPESFFSATGHRYDAYGGEIFFHTSSDINTFGLCASGSTELSVERCADASCADSAVNTDIAAVLISAGKNRNRQTGFDDTTRVVRMFSSVREDVDAYPDDGTEIDHFDDVVVTLSYHELLSSISCVDSSLQILTDYLPRLPAKSSFSVSVDADGGSPDYRWCVEYVPATGWLGGVAASADCQSMSLGLWTVADNPVLTGIAPEQSTWLVRVYLSDARGKQVSKPYAVTVQ